MKFKRVHLALLCAAVLASAATACSKPNGETGASGSPSSSPSASPPAAAETQIAEQADPFGKYDPPIQLHIARHVGQQYKYPAGDSIDNNLWTREYENTLGIQLILDWTANDGDYSKKLNVSIASGSLPEAFIVSSTQLKQLADAGQLEDLTDAFDKYAAPFTKELMNGDGGAALNSATFDGKLLAIPHINATIYGADVLWIREDWRKKLNLPEPKTMQDVFAISEAFAKQDPDGNGKDDTYGLAMNKDIYGGIASIKGFANGLHAYPTSWVKGADGKAVYGSVQPEMKEVLAKLQEMYKNGQIDREFGVKDGGKVGDSFAANKLGMQFGANWNPYYPLADGVKKNPGMEWKPYAIPSVDGTAAKASTDFSAYEYFVVRKGVKNPEAIVKMLNLAQEKLYGETREEKYLKLTENGELIETQNYIFVNSGLGNEQAMRTMQALRDAVNKKDKSLAEGVGGEADKYDAVMDYAETKNIENWGTYHQFKAFEVMLDSYSGANLLPTVFGGQTQTMAEKWSTLDKLEKETFTKIVMGTSSIDEFDTFVENWNKLGGADIANEVNEQLSTQP